VGVFEKKKPMFAKKILHIYEKKYLARVLGQKTISCRKKNTTHPSSKVNHRPLNTF